MIKLNPIMKKNRPFDLQFIGENDYFFDPVGQLFKNRKIKYWAENFFNPTSEELYDPNEMKNMEEAVIAVANAIKANKRIHIIIDEDADGYTSASILYKLLQKLGHKTITYTVHDKKTHGIILTELERDTNYEFDLLLMADGGSNDFLPHSFLKDMGKEIVILDHHEISHYSEHAIVVNHQLDRYPNKELSGAGVCHRFAESLLLFMGELDETFLDTQIAPYACLGIVADSMPLKNTETRYIVKSGIKNTNNFMLMREILNRKMIGVPKISDIAFYVAPYFNALIRMGTKEQKLKMFDAMINPTKKVLEADKVEHTTAKDKKTFGNLSTKKKQPVTKFLFQEVADEMVQARDKQNAISDGLIGTIEPTKSIEGEEESSSKALITIGKIGIMEVEGSCLIKGLLANKLTNLYGCPFLVVSYSEESGLYSGSARGVEQFTVDFKKDVLESDLFDMAEGHPNAFGVRFGKWDLEEILKYFSKLYADKCDTIKVDFCIQYEDLKEDIFYKMDSLKAEFGNGFEEPLFLIQGVPYTHKEKEGDVFFNTARSVLKISSPSFNPLKFYPSEEDIENVTKSNTIDVIGTLGINEYNNIKTPQLIFEDYLYGVDVERQSVSVKKEAVKSVDVLQTEKFDWY